MGPSLFDGNLCFRYIEILFNGNYTFCYTYQIICWIGIPIMVIYNNGQWMGNEWKHWFVIFIQLHFLILFLLSEIFQHSTVSLLLLLGTIVSHLSGFELFLQEKWNYFDVFNHQEGVREVNIWKCLESNKAYKNKVITRLLI